MEGLTQRILLMVELRGTNLHALGKKAGLAQGHINNLVSGRRGSMKAETLLALARALDVTMDWLATGEGPIERPRVAPSSLAKSEPLQEQAAQRAEKVVADLKRDLGAKTTRQRR